MAQLTAEETRDSYIAKMGEELGRVFHAVAQDLTWMHWRWRQHRVLFGEKPERIDLMNQSASFFFYLVQQVFFEDTLLGISRLTAGKNSGGHVALTIQQLPELVAAQIRPEVQTLVDDAVSAAAFAVEWRNNHIAHRNLKRALGEKVKALPDATREKVENALEALRAVLNCVERSYCKAITAYDSPPLEGAKALLQVLSDGIARREERQAAWLRGESGPPIGRI